MLYLSKGSIRGLVEEARLPRQKHSDRVIKKSGGAWLLRGAVAGKVDLRLSFQVLGFKFPNKEKKLMIW